MSLMDALRKCRFQDSFKAPLSDLFMFLKRFLDMASPYFVPSL